MKQKNQARIKPLAIKIYEEGKCFICGNACNEDSYAHYDCCIAYADHKEKKQKEENEKCLENYKS